MQPDPDRIRLSRVVHVHGRGARRGSLGIGVVLAAVAGLATGAGLQKETRMRRAPFPSGYSPAEGQTRTVVASIARAGRRARPRQARETHGRKHPGALGSRGGVAADVLRQPRADGSRDAPDARLTRMYLQTGSARPSRRAVLQKRPSHDQRSIQSGREARGRVLKTTGPCGVSNRRGARRGSVMVAVLPAWWLAPCPRSRSGWPRRGAGRRPPKRRFRARCGRPWWDR
jgi:hypothetical protein